MRNSPAFRGFSKITTNLWCFLSLLLKIWPRRVPFFSRLRFLRQTFFQQQFGRFRTLGTNCTVHTCRTWRQVRWLVGWLLWTLGSGWWTADLVRRFIRIKKGMRPKKHIFLKHFPKSSFEDHCPTYWKPTTDSTPFNLWSLNSTLSTCLPSRILVGPRPLEDLSRSQPWHTTPNSSVFLVSSPQISTVFHENLPSLKLTWPLKIGLLNRKVVFQPSIFRGYVSFWESMVNPIPSPWHPTAILLTPKSPTCTWPWGCMNPPITPKVQKRSELSCIIPPGQQHPFPQVGPVDLANDWWFWRECPQNSRHRVGNRVGTSHEDALAHRPRASPCPEW